MKVAFALIISTLFSICGCARGPWSFYLYLHVINPDDDIKDYAMLVHYPASHARNDEMFKLIEEIWTYGRYKSYKWDGEIHKEPNEFKCVLGEDGKPIPWYGAAEKNVEYDGTLGYFKNPSWNMVNMSAPDHGVFMWRCHNFGTFFFNDDGSRETSLFVVVPCINKIVLMGPIHKAVLRSRHFPEIVELWEKKVTKEFDLNNKKPPAFDGRLEKIFYKVCKKYFAVCCIDDVVTFHRKKKGEPKHCRDRHCKGHTCRRECVCDEHTSDTSSTSASSSAEGSADSEDQKATPIVTKHFSSTGRIERGFIQLQEDVNPNKDCSRCRRHCKSSSCHEHGMKTPIHLSLQLPRKRE